MILRVIKQAMNIVVEKTAVRKAAYEKFCTLEQAFLFRELI